MGFGILLRGLVPSPIHSLRGIPGALLASLTQRGNLPDLLRHCVLQASPGGAAGDQIRQRSIKLRPVVPRAEPDTAGGAEAEQ
ncbi:hypothetical protein A7R79_22495 [Pseudomonas aeruginosa]|nr:hypothetical protein BMR72_10650 [Pseudomonas aeruginosa]OES66917.1 hypothetical protein A7R79_22495 [Pseudomonas aeruginosa]OFQ83620.1 hypothetical protein HMPREF2924_05105 [Pseudomonas sp. HMSC063H08]OXY96398.1 hypothetical protein ACG87_30570 [Pseudomonas aeruginosa]